MFRLRIAAEVWRSVSQSDPEFDQTIQEYINEEDGVWVFPNPQPRGAANHLIEAGRFRLWLAKPAQPGCDYEIIHIQELEPREHTPPSQGAQIDPPITVLPPAGTGTPTPAPAKTPTIELPRALTTPTGQIIFLLRIPTYRQLPEHEQEPVNMAWRRAKYGRSAKRVFWKDDAIFLLTPDNTAPTNPNAVAYLSEALEQADAGRLITDPYEVKRALELAEKFGETVNQSAKSGKSEG